MHKKTTRFAVASQRTSMASDIGSVTAEFVIAMPAVIAVVLILLGSFSLQLQKFDLTEKAAIAARAFARGESVDLIEGAFGKTINLDLIDKGELVCAEAQRQVGILGFENDLFAINASHCARRTGL
jgi:hypothetical protein